MTSGRGSDNFRAALYRFPKSAKPEILLRTMGVPGLASQLHKYGSYVSTTQRKVDREQRAFATIDGPSLAHSLYRQGKHRPSKGGVIAQCDYHAIGQAAVAWLDWLRSYGFEM